jgi:hypothetical protein
MAKTVKKSALEVPTIDVSLVTITYGETEFGFDTSNKVAVEPQVETTDAVKLVVKGILRAQKPEQQTITGHKITLTDNVFNLDLVMLLQGGTVVTDEVTSAIKSYQPPVVGTKFTPTPFTLNCYSAQYDTAGLIVNYEKISYPNCQGLDPISFGSEDGAFRAPEYVINSSPKKGEAPYKIEYIAAEDMPTLVE